MDESTEVKLARVETRVDSLKEDTATIRSTMHDINGNMQRFVFAEEKCQAALANILEKMGHLPQLAIAMGEFTEIRPKLLELIGKDAKKAGVTSFLLVVSSAVVGIVTLLAGLAALVYHLFMLLPR